MTNVRLVLVALMGFVPTSVLAHGPGGHPADPDLHVGTEYDQCYVKFAPELTQSAFRRFAREFGSVSAFKMNSPPTTLGKWRVALGLEQLSVTIEDRSDAWNDTFAHPDAYHELGSDQSFPKVRARVGITDRMDVGAFWTKNPSANYGWLGFEAKYGLLQQSQTMPISLALRGAYTKTLYVEDMDMHAITADVAAGRTFWNVFTPYLDLGTDLVLARETTEAVVLESERLLVPRATGGFELRYWHVGFGAEVHVSDLTSYQLSLSAMF